MRIKFAFVAKHSAVKIICRDGDFVANAVHVHNNRAIKFFCDYSVYVCDHVLLSAVIILVRGSLAWVA